MDGGFLEITNYGNPSDVKIKDNRNPLLKEVREELELIFADIDISISEFKDAKDELIESIKDIKKDLIK